MRFPLAALLVAAMLLAAGCLKKGDDAPTDVTMVTPTQDLSSLEMPDGREGQFAAFNETNATEQGVGGIEHRHDYWQNRTRVVVAEQKVEMFPCCYQTTPGARSLLFHLEPGALIYEGAGSVEITISKPVRRSCGAVVYLYDPDGPVCTDRVAPVDDPAGGPAGLHLLVRDALMDEAQDAGEMKWNAPFVIPITDPRQTDMPHATNSLWDFQFRGDDPALGTLGFSVHIEAVRDPERNVPDWPGHPDFYAEAPDRVVLAKPGAVTKENGPTTFVDPIGSAKEYHAPEKLVSWGTKTLHVWANISNVKADNPALEPSAWRLLYYNASGVLNASTLDEHTGDVRELAWTLDVDDAGMDNPYAPHSRWGFAVQAIFYLPTADAPLLGCTGLCASYEVTYDLTVHASAASRAKVG